MQGWIVVECLQNRLLQEYIVDAYGKVELERLLFHRYNQDKIRADLYSGLSDAVREQMTQS